MLYAILFVFFFFYTHKQIYAASHFTGASKGFSKILGIVAIINVILEITYLIYFAIKVSWLQAIILLITAFIVTGILGRIVAKIVIRKLIKDGDDIHGEYFLAVYNYKCDIASTLIADIGLIHNIIVIVIFLRNIFA